MIDNPAFVFKLYQIVRDRCPPDPLRRTVRVPELRLRIITITKNGTTVLIWKGPDWVFELHNHGIRGAKTGYSVENIRGSRDAIEGTLMSIRMMA